MSRVDRNTINETKKPNRKTRKGSKFPRRKYQLLLLLAMAIFAIGFLLMIIVVNAFPASMTLAFIITMLVMIALTWFLFLREKKLWRIVGIIISVIFLLTYGLGIYYLSTTYVTFARISTEENSEMDAISVDVTEKPFNVYITGIDQWESEKGMDLERSDVNMIATINPKTKKILLTSIPRDTYVRLHTAGEMDKLTHTGVYGVDETLNTVQDWLGLDMNYYVKMNFSAVTDIVNAMGGIEVYSPKSFVPVKRSWWTVEKGWNHMNGKEALAFARERKAFGDKDSERVENQQRVVKAILKKMLSSSTLLTKYGDIMAVAGDNMSTNVTDKELQALIKMQLADLSGWDIETQKITGEYDMDYVASLTQEEKFLVYKPDVESVDAAIEEIDKVMNPSAAEIAAATADRQKNSLFGFIKGIIGK